MGEVGWQLIAWLERVADPCTRENPLGAAWDGARRKRGEVALRLGLRARIAAAGIGNRSLMPIDAP